MSIKICETCTRPTDCSGRGRCLGDDCPTCDGQGRVAPLWEADLDGRECPDCSGTGKADYPVCAAMRKDNHE